MKIPEISSNPDPTSIWMASLAVPENVDKDDFHPEPSNRDEFYEEYKPQRVISQEFSDLWRAVLEQALWDYKEAIRVKRYDHEFKEVFNWFFNETHDRVGSFNFVCDSLFICNTMILKSLIKYTKEHSDGRKRATKSIMAPAIRSWVTKEPIRRSSTGVFSMESDDTQKLETNC